MRIDCVVVTGAAGRGRSARILQLRAEFAAVCVLDGWDGLDGLDAVGALILTNADPFVPPPNSMVMSYERALAFDGEVRLT